jgi:hypothetical protein
VQAAERNDAAAQALINEFCELINFPYQQQQGLFAVGFYHSVLPVASPRVAATQAGDPAAAAAVVDEAPATDEGPLEPEVADADASEPLGNDDVTIDAAPAVPAPEAEVDLDDVDVRDDDPSSDEPSTRQNA